MVKITVTDSSDTKIIEVQEGSNLLTGLIKAGFNLYSPCGGNGTCGKCKVYIKSEGFITSCLYPVNHSIEVNLPGKLEANILVSQYKYTRQLPFNPGIICNSSFYPIGIAIDIGTTSIVFYLVNLITGSLIETRAHLNPQIKYGADVISRINYCINNKDGLKKLQSELIELINLQIEQFAEFVEVSPNEIIKITVAGNTTMLHILLGKDPSSLAFVPFTPVFLDQKILKASELGLNCFPAAEIVILPSISAYIGSDIVAGLTSLAPSEKIKKYLFIDIGTNGEMALVNNNEIYACATAAGPAFEGANISCGMAAIDGAISAYSSSEYKTIGNASPTGICGSGLIDITAHLLKSGLLTPDGLLREEFIIITEDNKISLTQKDIRELQLAKSAILSGIRILIKNANINITDLEAIFLAGGFGNYINIENAIKIGLIPAELKDKIIPVGNTSGTGAMLALKSENYYEILDQTIRKTKNIELANDEDFALEFAMNMDFPL
jgi:uncharacterized 2Fe-2S/4Fe-4S cluster protein (DUF4445 family)